MCLAQRKAPGRNEAAGALEVLGLLDLEGCIVTADALHCHRDFASTVLERGADYVLALKENQSKLFAAAARRYARSGARSVAERREPATHDRCEWRRATVLRDTTFAAVQKFPGVVALARITSRRRVLGACAEPPQVRYFLLMATAASRLVEQRMGLLPSPLWGGVGGGGGGSSWRMQLCAITTTPLPSPPPQGGREQTAVAARAGSISTVSASLS